MPKHAREGAINPPAKIAMFGQENFFYVNAFVEKKINKPFFSLSFSMILF